jgi:hypothetical protein
VTRASGQVTALQATLGGCVLLLAAVAVVVALGHLVEREEQLPELGAPAQDEPDDICPAPAGPTSDQPVVVTADELIECPASFDGAEVRYRGEAVRAVLRRGPRSWVQRNDDPYGLELGPLYDHRTTVGGNSGIPVSIPTSVADTIAYVGGPRHRGDIIEVTGVFYRADPRDGGGPAIEADAATITRVGRPVRRSVDNARLLTAAVIAAIALGTALLAHVRSPERVRRL